MTMKRKKKKKIRDDSIHFFSKGVVCVCVYNIYIYIFFYVYNLARTHIRSRRTLATQTPPKNKTVLAQCFLTARKGGKLGKK